MRLIWKIIIAGEIIISLLFFVGYLFYSSNISEIKDICSVNIGNLTNLSFLK
jgi:hypothetical protein